MRMADSFRLSVAITVCIAAPALATGCSAGSAGAQPTVEGAQTNLGAPVYQRREGAPAPKSERTKHRACGKSLSFLSDYNNGLIDVYRGTILCKVIYGLSNPNGLAVDRSGDLFVAQKGTSTIAVLDPPYDSVTSTLSDPGEDPAGIALCNGYAAVTNIETNGGQAGSVSIYVGSSTQPTYVLQDANAAAEYSAACDGDGNLFTSYLTPSGGGAVNEWAGGKGTPIELGSISTGFPGGLQFERNALWVGDQRTPRVSVWPKPFTEATKTIILQGSDDPVDFVIDDRRRQIIVSDAALNEGILFTFKGAEAGTLSGNGGGLAVGIAHFDESK
jgi:hypothetical protein